MRQQCGAVIVLEEDGLIIDDVEGGAVGELHLCQGGLFRQDLVDVGSQERVACQEGLAQGALDGGFEFGFGTRGDTIMVSLGRKREDR